jgi:hypothetical protein
MKTTTGMTAVDRCAGVVDTCASRHVASPAFDDNYFVDPLRGSLGMRRPEQPKEEYQRKGPFQLEGFLEIDTTGKVSLR